MILAKALKVKNRLVKKINSLQQDITGENSIRVDNERKIVVTELMETLHKTIEELIRLKIAIFAASTPMRENILRLGELKSRIVFLQGIDTAEGKMAEKDTYHRTSSEVEYAVEFDKLYIKEEVGQCEEKIDELQEELDQFNHKTDVEI